PSLAGSRWFQKDRDQRRCPRRTTAPFRNHTCGRREVRLSRNHAVGFHFRRCFYPLKAGRFSTALQLGKGLRILPQSRRHQSRSRGGTASLMVVFPLGWLMVPAVTNNQKRRLWMVTLVCQPRCR